MSSVKGTGGHYGSFRLWGSLGFGISALLFGVVFRKYGLEYFTLCYFVLMAFCFVLSLFLRDAVYAGKRAGLSDIRQIFSDRRVIAFLLITALLSSSNKANDTFMGIFIRQIGGNADTVGYAWTVAALSEVPVMALGGMFLARVSELKLLAAAALVFAGRWALFSIVSDPKLIVLIQLTHSLSFALFFICSVSYMNRLVPDNLRSSGQGLLSSFLGGVAGIAGSVLGGIVMSKLGSGSFYTACSMVALIACAFYIYRAWRDKKAALRAVLLKPICYSYSRSRSKSEGLLYISWVFTHGSFGR
ncbi:MAG: MFS transporter, partial [Bacillota bacterium]